jgi:hypothetical protein
MKLHTMGKIILLELLLCAITMQSQEVLWEKSYGGKHAEHCNLYTISIKKRPINGNALKMSAL